MNQRVPALLLLFLVGIISGLGAGCSANQCPYPLSCCLAITDDNTRGGQLSSKARPEEAVRRPGGSQRPMAF